ncbi:MAG TPA: hypothetical protein VI669_05680 [Vicinamibacteria bacterium]
MRDRVRLSTGGGPLGTGVFLLHRRGDGTEAWEARAWVCLLFVPLVPLRAARFNGPRERPLGESWEVERSLLEAAPRGDVGRTYAAAAGLLLATVAPVAWAWWTIDVTTLPQALKVVIGSSVPILVLLWRDARTPRLLG